MYCLYSRCGQAKAPSTLKALLFQGLMLCPALGRRERPLEEERGSEASQLLLRITASLIPPSVLFLREGPPALDLNHLSSELPIRPSLSLRTVLPCSPDPSSASQALHTAKSCPERHHDQESWQTCVHILPLCYDFEKVPYFLRAPVSHNWVSGYLADL